MLIQLFAPKVGLERSETCVARRKGQRHRRPFAALLCDWADLCGHSLGSFTSGRRSSLGHRRLAAIQRLLADRRNRLAIEVPKLVKFMSIRPACRGRVLTRPAASAPDCFEN